MKAIVIEKYGKHVPVLMKEMPVPDIGDHDVLVEIYAASLNPIDYKIKEGKLKFLLSYSFPLILGNDFSGVVVKVGKGVKAFQPGDEVYGRPRKSRIGTLAEYISIHEDDLMHKPNNLSFIEAASIPLVGLTTYQAFTEILKLQPGQKILIHAGAGGVGTFAIQLAKRMGAYVATTASERGYDLVKSLGADEIIDYRKQLFEELLSGYDAVYDTIGGEVLEKSFRILKPGGRIVSVSGIPNARFGRANRIGWAKTAILSMASRKLTMLEKKSGTSYHFLFMKPSGSQLKILKEFIEEGHIKPVIDRIYPLKDSGEALNYLASGTAKGKVVISMK